MTIDAPDTIVPTRTLRNITLIQNIGNEVMVVSLGCEKRRPDRLLPPGSFEIVDVRHDADVGASEEAVHEVVCLQRDRDVRRRRRTSRSRHAAIWPAAGTT